MSAWQPFGATGDPGTCLWCGRKLRYGQVMAADADKGDPMYKEQGVNFATVRAAKPGYYADGLFCGAGCGYQYAVAVVRGHLSALMAAAARRRQLQ